jgi:hypothetical protein
MNGMDRQPSPSPGFILREIDVMQHPTHRCTDEQLAIERVKRVEKLRTIDAQPEG